MVAVAAGTEEIWKILESITDPEIPAVSIVDLGIVRSVSFNDAGALITITPTYSGCPAMKTIEDEIKSALASGGIEALIETRLSPAWTTDWITERGRESLSKSGIAPPRCSAADELVQFSTQKRVPPAVPCPYCGSEATEEKSRFGSTACKALYVCGACGQPFDYFKPF